jgi:hypothetical protein
VNVNDYSILSANYLDDVLPAGDFDGNLFVNGEDFSEIASNWQDSVTVGTDGDGNSDGFVDRDDVLTFDGLWLEHMVSRPEPLIRIPGDADDSGGVGTWDAFLVMSHYNQSVPANTNGDVNGDGLVNVSDFSIVSANQGESFADATDDGFTDIDDLDVVALNWGQLVGGGKADGDFNLDGVVDDVDLAVIGDWWKFSYNDLSSSPASVTPLGEVPEPTALIPMTIAAVVSICAARRRHA